MHTNKNWGTLQDGILLKNFSEGHMYNSIYFGTPILVSIHSGMNLTTCVSCEYSYKQPFFHKLFPSLESPAKHVPLK
jgi:hypothetical protein